MELFEKKNLLRQELLKKRGALSKKEWQTLSGKIHKRLLDLPEIRKAGKIHCYISMANRNEVDTLDLINVLLKEGKEIMVPVIHPGTFKLDHSALTSIKDLKAHKWGVLEPETIIQVNPEDSDVIIVPMVGADERKNRIGYGKGFYDRFLGNIEKTRIGLCFECCVENELPVENFDVPLDMIVTENRVIV